MKHNLAFGETYIVTHKDSSHRNSKLHYPTKRIFLGTEKRFGDIPCYRFTSRITKKVKTEIKDKKLIITGAVLQEISIPEYDLVNIESLRN